jgi:UDP-N-acetylmuramoyl-L-alanyl-D-glutamate--2,6-diaminopimelate ligase
MNLMTLIDALPEKTVHGDPGVDITEIEFDSRRVGGGALFVCLEGLASDGHDFAAAAVRSGAAALVVNRLVPGAGEPPQILVADTREALARLAAAFEGYPARSLEVLGATGTNGKTTVTQLLAAIGTAAGRPTDVFGTLGNTLGGQTRGTRFTTPEAPRVQRLLHDAAEGGARWVAMEVSSHALAQRRVFGLDFSAVVFTNLTRDHLDYHGTLDAYREAKTRLFTPEGRGSDRPAVAVLNLEDPTGRSLFETVLDPKAGYGFGAEAAYRAVDLDPSPRGTAFLLETPRGGVEVGLPLVGRFNVLNALAAAAVAVEWGAELTAVKRGLESVTRVPGRMDVAVETPFAVIVDYAHTPDALEAALTAVREFTPGRVLLVFGCGGDRDRGKRPEMAAAAERGADAVWVTSDNPRTEDPEMILDEILTGASARAAFRRDADRRAAIRGALEAAAAGDTVLIAGKGHETVQIMGTEERPFDDRAVAREILGRID